jgi:DNA-binding transcriptional MerR regulator
MKLKIGDFARIGRVTVQTLRHYDNLNLLKPSQVDSLSGYRYYDLAQLPRLNRILALKDLGFSLDQVAHMLQDEIPLSELRNMLRLKQSELQQEVQEQLDRLERLQARLRMIEDENNPIAYEVIVKQIEPILVYSVRGVIASYWEISPLWQELSTQIKQYKLEPVEPYLALYHSGEPEIDTEVCAPLTALPPDGQHLPIRELEAAPEVASTIHHGSYSGLAAAYAALLSWVHANGYRITGPDREIYLRLPDFELPNDENAITELQVPIRKVD